MFFAVIIDYFGSGEVYQRGKRARCRQLAKVCQLPVAGCHRYFHKSNDHKLTEK